MKDSNPTAYEDIPAALAVASKEYLLSEILDRLAALEEENARKDEKIAALEDRLATLERDHNEVADFNARERATDRQRIAKLETPAPALRQKTATEGTKTAARIEELKARLKRRRGRAPFSELREEMGLSKSQFSKLAGHLDNRIFDIQRHPAKAREKVLILRQQIG